MPELRLRSANGLFGLVVDAGQFERILGFCRDAGNHETGGVLIGRYSSALDCALVDVVLGPPSDSTQGRSWFIRGVSGIQATINRVWHWRRNHYLGEWHFHPFAQPSPSHEDCEQMQTIAEDASWECPEPVLLIVGGDPRDDWRVHAEVFAGPKGRVTLRDG